MRALARAGACAVVAAGALSAQLAFFSGEQRLGDTFSVGAVPAGALTDAPFRLKNVGTAGTTVTELARPAGVGFSLRDVPPLPVTLAPGAALDFTVRFEPSQPGSYSASLRAGDAVLLVSGLATPSVQVYLQAGDALQLLASGAAADFGTVERGGTAMRQFLLRSPAGQPATYTAVSVEGAGFHLAKALAAPLFLNPGESATLAVVCEPAVSGPLAALLRVDQRSFALRATATEPPLPQPTLVVDLASARSGQQGRVSVRLASPSRTRASGEVRISFAPATPGTPGDPGVVFATGGFTAPFTVEQGDSNARFAAGSSVDFQTGSAAGTITFTIAVNQYLDQRGIIIPPAAVAFSSGRASRGGGVVDLDVAGWDNTRSVSRLTFTFYDTSGAVIPPGAINVDATAEFRRYFDASGLGGLFALHARFPVSGAGDRIAGVDVEITNASTSTRVPRLPL